MAGRAAAHRRFPPFGAAAYHPAMLIGRDVEVGGLTGALARGRSTVVVGEPGGGRSAVLAAAAAASGRPVLAGGGLASLRWMPWLPLVRALRRQVPAGDRAAVAAFVEARVGGGVLVVDDLHCADTDTLAVLPSLGQRVACLASVPVSDPLTGPLVAALRAAGWAELRLPGLGDEAAAELLGRLAPGLGPAEVARLVALAGGNPRYLEELAATGGTAAGSLRELVEARLGGCSAEAATALAVLGLLARPAPPELVGPAADELRAAGLLADAPGGRVGPRHGVVAEVAVARLAGPDRRALHAELAGRLPDPGEAARHHAAAGQPEPAVTKALEAAERAATPGERARHLALAAGCSAGPAADGLRLRAADGLLAAGEVAAAERLLAAVVATDSRPAAACLLARAAWLRGDVAAAERAVLVGLDQAAGTGSAAEVGLRVEGARLAVEAGADRLQARVLAREACELALTTGHEVPRARTVLGIAALRAGSPSWAAELEGAMAAAVAAGEADVELLAAYTLVAGHLAAGDPAVAAGLADAMAERAGALGLAGWSRHFRAAQVWLDVHHRGAYASAVAAGRELLAEPLPPLARRQVETALVLALADTGAAIEADGLLAAAEAAGPIGPAPDAALLWARAEAEWLAGRPGAALTAAERCLALGTAAGPFLAGAAVTRGWAGLDAGRVPDPPVAAGLAADAAAAWETAGVARLASGDALAAEELLDSAAAAWAGRQLRAELRAAWGAGTAAAGAGEAAKARATRRLIEVEALAGGRGLVALLGRIERSLRLCGVRRAAARRAAEGGLTGRERDVLALVGEGCRTAEIARRLGITPATVETLIRTAKGKLGAATRTQAAVLASGDADG
jgi:DNA-binding CsgD family transcriptional regulator